MSASSRRTEPRLSRRRWVAAATAVLALRGLPVRAAPAELPDIPELSALLAGRTPRAERLRMEIPRIADDGHAVPVRLTVSGPFAAGAHVRSLALFAERNPVRTMIVVEYPLPAARAEFETRVRLAGTQRVVATAVMADDAVFVAMSEVVVAASACLDGT